ncbi:hypothetical protein CACET_c15450 [Clostridium aceticum]|uniref:Uncharacterized protein n=1 Tax=Clostridium aceticum TaxID=84022 RepID=A0A0D8ICU4_9CLOT|nr:hypothetical protein [Clostridium aceticum]AKL94994.1 hypothetical protein CACET_c15450 [Clostridium aceticum]KJF27899.1 hypothetical protein TZ02_04790 [Clostridium aceticum]
MQRVKKINDYIKILENKNVPESKRDLAALHIKQNMNLECHECKYSLFNRGECYGKKGGNPCLVFKKAERQTAL